MNDRTILELAIEASGLAARRFAVEVLDVDERTVRRWLAGERTLHGTVRRVCLGIIRRPSLATELAAIAPPSGNNSGQNSGDPAEMRAAGPDPPQPLASDTADE